MARPIEEKVDMIFAYGEAQGNLSQAVRIFNERHENSPPTSRVYLRSLVDKFRRFFPSKMLLGQDGRKNSQKVTKSIYLLM